MLIPWRHSKSEYSDCIENFYFASFFRKRKGAPLTGHLSERCSYLCFQGWFSGDWCCTGGRPWNPGVNGGVGFAGVGPGGVLLSIQFDSLWGVCGAFCVIQFTIFPVRIMHPFCITTQAIQMDTWVNEVGDIREKIREVKGITKKSLEPSIRIGLLFFLFSLCWR